MTEEDLDLCLGTRITLTGMAGTARLGAVLEVGEHIPVYVDGKDAWDKEHEARTATVTGILEKRRLAPPAGTDSAGESTSGLEGEASYVLVDRE